MNNYFKNLVAAYNQVNDEDLKSLIKEIPMSIIKTNTYIPFYYRVALYAQKLGMPWIVSIIRNIIDFHSGYNKNGNGIKTEV